MATIVRTDDVLGGDPRLEGTRIGVYHVYDLVVPGGSTPEEAADQLDIDLGQVYGALSYYYENSDEMAEVRARHRDLEDELRSKSTQPPSTAR
ncbi:DUF433 domain-containing protein [Halovivax gelatinilyticus]|uniref:DUF433 domain-containing protein n=1 Tax=Halovivax gelatinilyticus TaxID=2961597 RepID=UPI0020CA5AA3|nr:DUF433 domain-containing protein [Halovivax gelatinilyticus]